MAIYNLHVSPSRGRSVLEKFNYINREEKYSYLQNDKYDDFIYSENINMPSFATDNPKKFWESVELYERSNANHFREIEFTIPYELNEEERIEVATEFAKKIFKDEYVYSLAIHNKKSSIENIDNIHCHIIFSERKLDGIDRNEEQFFKNFKSKTPSLGGCQKIDWSRKSILYGIRKEWETTANEYLTKYNTNISSLSLEKQRLNALLEENYLKAEMLDREGINIDLQTYKYSNNSEYRETAIKYFEECKRIKEYKEKLYNLRCQNFEEENNKAKERFLKGEVEEINFSNFDMENKEEFNQNILQETQKIVNNIINNNISILENENEIEKLKNISEIELEENALNILTNNEYSEKTERLNKLQYLYNKTPIKENFIYKKELHDLNDYFLQLSKDKELQVKIISLKHELSNTNNEKIKILKENNKSLQTNFHLENTIETNKVLVQTENKLITLHIELEEIKNKIYVFKQDQLNKKNILFDIYKNMNKEYLIDKYTELDLLKENLSNAKDEEEKRNLSNKINLIEGSLIKFNLINNIDIKLESILEERNNSLNKMIIKQTKLENEFKVVTNLIDKYSKHKSNNIEQILENYNFENIFKTSLDIEILINRKESRIKQLQLLTDNDIRNKALNILTKNQFNKNLKELNTLNELYEKTPIKENFAFKYKKEQLEEYFQKLDQNEYFQDKLKKIQSNIKNKYQLEKDQLGEELKDLRQSQYKNIYKEISDESTVLTKIIQRETFNSLSDLYEKAKKTDQRVKDYKNKLNETDILFGIYRENNREDIIEKYNELDNWKKELATITEENKKEELSKKINAREGSLLKFNIKNNITERVEEELQQRKKIFKSLRQEQDDIKGQIAYLKDLNKILSEKLHNIYNIEMKSMEIKYNTIKKQDSSNEVSSTKKLYNKLLHNINIEDLESTHKINLENLKFEINLTEPDKVELRKLLIEKINTIVDENKLLEIDTNINILKDDKTLEKYILDKKTNNEYSKELNRIKFYEEQINKNIDVEFYKSSILETKNRIKKIIMNNPIDINEKNKIKANIRSKAISNITKLHMNKKQIRLLYSSLKKITINTNKNNVTDLISSAFNKIHKIVNNNSIPQNYNYDKKIYVLGEDKIIIEDDDTVEKERRKVLCQNQNSYSR
ncbi:MobA/MobL family protein [Fusobacterium sp. SYSU M8D902]|uniref:MobA/MobL family protein n=1 Tax=Fusobacterium sp. SYSU M8D902 TaxID=3159562 RepID=UPI0032E510F4